MASTKFDGWLLKFAQFELLVVMLMLHATYAYCRFFKARVIARFLN